MMSAPDMVLVADEDLQRLAEENGPASAEAQALAQLKSQRSQDLQVHCYRVDDTYVTRGRCRPRRSPRVQTASSSKS